MSRWAGLPARRVASGYVWLMRPLRMSGLPAILLTLVMGFGILLPEAGHSLAHRQGGVHGSQETVDHIEADHAVRAVVSAGHAADSHPHPDLVATLPGRPLLAYALAAQTIRWLLGDPAPARRVAPAIVRALAPIQSGHGPPPPTRAPPHI